MCRGLSGSFLAMRILVRMKIGKFLFYICHIYEFEEMYLNLYLSKLILEELVIKILGFMVYDLDRLCLLILYI